MKINSENTSSGVKHLAGRNKAQFYLSSTFFFFLNRNKFVKGRVKETIKIYLGQMHIIAYFS